MKKDKIKSMNKKIRKIINRVTSITIVSAFAITTSFTMSSCGLGAQNQGFISESVRSSVENRIMANAALVDKLTSDGLLSKKTNESIKKSLDNNKEAIIKKLSEVTEAENDLTNCISSFSAITADKLQQYRGNTVIKNDADDDIICGDGNNGSVPYAEYSKYCFVNQMFLPTAEESFTSALVTIINDPASGLGEEKVFYPKGVEPLVLIADDSRRSSAASQAEDIASEINEKFSWPVYVLKPEILTENGDGSLDGVMEMMKQCIKPTSSEGQFQVSTGELANYFEAAVDKDGNPVTLLDVTEDKYKIVKESKIQKLFSPTSTDPGYDMVITQWDVPTMTLRFVEFSQETYDEINKMLGLENENKYIFCSSKNDSIDQNRVYLMEYPVWYLKQITHNGDTEVKGVLKQSGIGINLYNGNIIKYDQDDDGKWLATGKPVSEASDKYLTTDGASSNNEAGKSSFIVKGMNKIKVGLDGTQQTETVSGRIILRDYLEATFAPEFVPNENLVVFGRKIRMRFDDWETSEFKLGDNVVGNQYTPKWDKDSKAAYFVDKEGNEISNTADLYITDFCASEKLLEDKYDKCEVRVLAGKAEKGGKVEKTIETGETPTISDLTKNTIASDKTVKITISKVFPSEDIGEVDYKSDSPEKQRFYCLTTKSGLFETALFSEWINSTSKTASLDWWNGYLLENGFKYSVNHDEINDYLTNNYEYELSQNGVVILDLETVAKIQEQYDKDADKERVSTIVTLFMMLGWFLIVYSSILMLAWVIDTNTDLGFNVLTKLTFGHWVAIKYEEDMPYNNPNDQTFLTGGRMFLKTIIIIVMGILLIRVNIFDIVIRVIKLFGALAVEIERIIKGL